MNTYIPYAYNDDDLLAEIPTKIFNTKELGKTVQTSSEIAKDLGYTSPSEMTERTKAMFLAQQEGYPSISAMRKAMMNSHQEVVHDKICDLVPC